MSKQLTEELPQLDSFTGGHTSSYVFGLNGAQGKRFRLLAHPGYRSRTQRKTTSRSALAIHHNTIITMKPHISGSVSQSMSDCASKISQKILGGDPMYIMRLNHVLAQCVNCKTYVWMRFHQEQQCCCELMILKNISQL